MTEPVSRRVRIASKLYITAWWLLGTGWLVTTVSLFVALKPTPPETVMTSARAADHGEWVELSPEEVKALGLDKPSAWDERNATTFSYAKKAGLDSGAPGRQKPQRARALDFPPPKLSDRADEKSPPSRAPARAEFRMPTWLKEWALGSALAGLPWVLLVVGNRWLRWLLA